MDNETREKIKYKCEYCGVDIPYGSKRAVLDNDYSSDNFFCSQECFNEYHGLRPVDWSYRREYYQYTREEIKAMMEEQKEELKRKKAEEDAKRKEAEPLLRHIEEAIMNLVKEGGCDGESEST